jgi:hypothetical protein
MDGAGPAWRERIRALRPMSDRAAAANPKATELAPEVVAALDDAGVFAMMDPREVFSNLSQRAFRAGPRVPPLSPWMNITRVFPNAPIRSISS